MIENPPHTRVLVLDFPPHVETNKSSLDSEETELVYLGHIQCDGRRLERHNAVQGPGNGVQESFLGEASDNCVIDLEERARALLAFL